MTLNPTHHQDQHVPSQNTKNNHTRDHQLLPIENILTPLTIKKTKDGLPTSRGWSILVFKNFHTNKTQRDDLRTDQWFKTLGSEGFLVLVAEVTVLDTLRASLFHSFSRRPSPKTFTKWRATFGYRGTFCFSIKSQIIKGRPPNY